jgi:tetratricopeptide (TPR) repeat protein/transglutaminase-like putative cysteine protease
MQPMRCCGVPVLLLSLISPVLSQSQPADTSQEGAVIEKMLTRLHFENDGTSTQEADAAIRVYSEAGVQQYGQLVFGYSSATEKLVIDYVRVRKPGGEVIATPDSTAQDFAPEFLEAAPMYSDFRQRHITVVGLHPGDLLEYHATTKTFQPLATGQFWFEYSFPKDIPVTEARLDIEVPKSRDIHLKSPKQKYTTVDTADFRTYSWSAKNIVRDRSKKEAEESPSELENEGPDVQLTSFKDWQEVASWYAKLQGERVVVDDAVKKKALELTRGAATQKEKAQKLYDFVAKNIRYVSLSFGVGRLQPHLASEVLFGSYGDCKDKHTLLAALLSAAGIQSYPVMIGSIRKLDEDVPSPQQFDHVITAARIDKDLTFLDTTSEVAPFGLIMYQLRDKQALIAAEAPTGGLHKTPANVPVKNTISYEIKGKFSEVGSLDANVDMSMSGDSALPFRAIFRSASQADWPHVVEVFARFQGTSGDISKVEVAGLDDAYSPLHVRYAIHRDSYFTVPSESDGFYPFPQTGIAQIGKSKPGTMIDVGPAVEVHNKAHVEFANNYTVRIPPETGISREYGDFHASYQVTKNVLEAKEEFVLKVDKVPANRRSDVDSLRSVATNRAAQAISCSIHTVGNSGEVASLPSSASLGELRKAATSSLQHDDFRNAAELLKRVVQQEPSDPDAWDELGRAYAGMDDHANAIAAFQKQVAVNAAHKRAYDDLGTELQRQGKYDEAIGAYSKQLESNPTDRIARKNHALVLAKMKRSSEALSELEGLAAAPPQDLDVDLALAELYSNTGNNEKSRTLLDRVIGNPTLPPTGDVYAAALRDDIDSDATLSSATEILADIGEQFEDGVYKEDPEMALPAMQFVALQWARIGWADALKQQIEGVRYLDAAWKLSQSGTVANRLARIYQRGGDSASARRMLSLAVAAGGADLEDSRARLAKLVAAGSKMESSKQSEELSQARSVKINSIPAKSGEAEFLLVFDGSGTPDRVDFREGSAELRKAENSLLRAEYPVSFPDASSLKIVRRGTLTCRESGCVMTLKPVEPITIPAADASTTQNVLKNATAHQ